MTANDQLQFDTQHEDMIHDAQLDYYGKRLATCSSDGSIRLFDVSDKQQKFITALKGHTGPVWQVAWAHPKFGSVLASCSYDGSVLIWKDNAVIYKHDQHQASVNAIAWAPHELGPMLLCGSSDGQISLLKFNGTWESQMIRQAHATGVNAVSWAPVVATEGNAAQAGLRQQFATGGCDNQIKIWAEDKQVYSVIQTLDGHSDWVRDVAYAPNIGLPRTYLASCSQDKQVFIWNQEISAQNSEWKRQQLSFSDVVWRVSWSMAGNILAVSCGDNTISLWKENIKGEWECISKVDESGSKE
ncbi:GTPase-activating protein S13 [Coemansia sp. RSA 989]|nr:GTPase-activating protein S13 [Coemansia sp. RSA 1821]KAJ1865404.1 GTPase-activating protein S13 [Coemansia sp. RSA 989]KAJ1872721.1 GTPase-activating protein S13 [Coemansia sp. RSA 990]KAJ2647595.1 GTPase-activating protein S13 [Coemansia sp. RSA 1250]KAJ2669521.1 GTPase-activating protein S13 [Coemansia sp. RSA 1085]